MTTGWPSEIAAVFLKEARTEVRTKSGLLTAGLFSVVTVVALAFAAFGIKLSGGLAAGMLWVGLIFAAVISLPRTFLLEDEQRTADLLRLWARPHAIFWGKALFNLALMLLVGGALSLLFFGLVGVEVARPGLYIAALIGACLALAGTATFCGALVASASNQSVLAAAISVPLLLPLVALGVASMKIALGSETMGSGMQALIGTYLYAVASFSIGPTLFAAVWRN